MNQQSFETSSVVNRHKCKIVFLGDMGPTVAVDFVARNIVHKGVHYRLQFWDTAGQERFRSLISAYLKDANCAVIVFDVTSRQSFDNIKHWVQMFAHHKPHDAITILLGNKIDLTNTKVRVSSKQATQRAAELGLAFYMQLSAKTAEGIESFFDKIIESYKPLQNPKPSEFTNLPSKTQDFLTDFQQTKKQRRCCTRSCCTI